MAATVVVARGATSIIKPETSPEPHCMFLSAADIAFRWLHYALVVFFYKLGDDEAYEECVERMKASLSKALVAYYPWAGRLVEQADGRLTLDCNDAGVEFVKASINLPFSSLEEDNFQHKNFFQNFCTLAHIVEWSDDIPLLSIQVTRFPGGKAMALGVSSSHVVANGESAFNFFKSWGECARGLEMLFPPIHMREALCLENLIRPLVNKKGLSCAQGGRIFFKFPEPGVLTQYDFHFSSKTLMTLKHIASEEKPCSTFQALIAHIWKHVGLAKDLKDSDDFCLNIVGDFRRRINESLPQAYFGNAIMRNGTKAKMGDLQRESISVTVKRVQDLINSLDDRLFRIFYGTLELMPSSDLQKMILDRDIPTLLISGSPKFPIYDVEFGWGKPACVRSPCIRADGEVFLWMGKDQDGSIDVSLALNFSTMERLKLDTTFLSV